MGMVKLEKKIFIIKILHTFIWVIFVVKYLIFGFIILVILLLMGCRGWTDTGFLRYMERKYGEEFQRIPGYGSPIPSWPFNSRGMVGRYVSSSSFPERRISVVVNRNPFVGRYMDDYIDFYFESQTTNYIKQIADRYFNVFTILARTQSSWIKGEFNDERQFPNIAFENYLNEGRLIRAVITVEDLDEEVVKTFAQELKDLRIRFQISIVAVPADKGSYLISYSGDDKDIHFHYDEIGRARVIMTWPITVNTD
ncbi:MAG: hypothetical protein FWD82_06715 [Defluviitaleaceae bacterium]|nr:hypothetical protein [Defluviitaleaceae bacterium]